MNNTTSDAKNILRIKDLVVKQFKYVVSGVWNDTRTGLKVSLIKIINLSVRSFLDGGLQGKACALTYHTALALVPALALFCAIGRGFGLQDFLKNILIQQIPSQAQALDAAFGFVDSYLSNASGGLFVGVGIIFLLWTLISLLRNIEKTFNKIWQTPKNRSFLRMFADYLSILIVIPIMLLSTSGITIFMSTSISQYLPFEITKPAIELLIDFSGIVLSWLMFTATYILIPNTKVRFKNAIIPGILVGTACQVLQWLFISGQLYVSKYNAIYGSFSFIPLLLIWIQLIWLFTLIGGVLCYAIQNIDNYNYGSDIKRISVKYRCQVTIAIMSIIAKRFKASLPPLSPKDIAKRHHIPINLVIPVLLRLRDMGLVNFVDAQDKELNEHPAQPAIDVENLTVADMMTKIMDYGSRDFVPGFYDEYYQIKKETEMLATKISEYKDSKRLIDIELKDYYIP